MSFQLAWPWLLASLPLPLLAAMLPAAPERPRAGLRFPFPGVLRSVSAGRPRARSRARLIIAALAWVLLVVAAARPQRVGDTVHLPVAGRNVMLAVDLSGSMQTPDMRRGDEAVSRLAAVKGVAGDFIRRRVGDRLGLILFGDQAYLQTPLTLDRHTVLTLLDEAQIGLAGRQTAIGDAIGLAIKRLRDEPAGDRVLILLTDGASNSGSIEPLKAADLAAQEGVRIYTIGVGGDPATSGDPFAMLRGGDSDLDEDALKAIAHKTGGRYFRASDVASLAQIYGEIDRIEPRAKDEQSWRPVDELYLWPLAASLLLCAAIALSELGLATIFTSRVRHA